MATIHETQLDQASPQDLLEDGATSQPVDKIARAAQKLLLELSHQIMLFYSDDPLAPESITHLLGQEYSVLLDCTQTDYDQHEYLSYCRRLRKICPDLEIYVINATAQIINYSVGVVYIPFQMNNLPGGINRKVTHVLKWRKRDGEWTCYGHLGFQGLNMPARVEERDGEEESMEGGRKGRWWTFPKTAYEDAKASCLSSVVESFDRSPVSRTGIDEMLMKRFT